MTTALAWTNNCEAMLSAEMKEKLELYREAYREAKALRLEFEQAVIQAVELPQGKTIKFSYNFGRLGMAVADGPAPKPVAAPKPKLSLSDWLDRQ